MSLWPENYKNTDLLDRIAIKTLAITYSIGERNAQYVLGLAKQVAAKQNIHTLAQNGQDYFHQDFGNRVRGNYQSQLFQVIANWVLDKNSKDSINHGFQCVGYVLGFAQAVHWFVETRTNPTVEGKCLGLQYLSPSAKPTPDTPGFNAAIPQLTFLGNVIRAEAQQAIASTNNPKIKRLQQPHIAGFGTGGDGIHTINMTTLAMPIAALYYASIQKPQGDLPFIKLSTKAVTGKIGGADIAEKFLQEIKKPDNFDIITLGELGFPYSPELVQARKQFAAIETDGYLIDPYKVIYPPVNLSNALYVSTGCHPRLFETAEKVAESVSRLEIFGNKNAPGTYDVNEDNMQFQLLIASKSGNDEYMPGNNMYGAVMSGVIFTDNVPLYQHMNPRDMALALAFLTEQPSVELQAKRMHQILGVKHSIQGIPESATEIVAINSALCLPEVIVNAGLSAEKFHQTLQVHTRGIVQMLQEMQKDKNNPMVTAGRNRT